MTVQLTQKERSLLQDQQSHEQVCVNKYNEYSQKAEDPQLQQLFSTYASQEQQHLDTVNQLLSGTIPSMQQAGQQSGAQQQSTSGNTQMSGQSGNSTTSNTSYSKQDEQLCNDLLMTEKYVSSTYNTAIFEFTNSQIRDTLNHIQKEEQQHGEGIFQYMQTTGMYKPQ